ncbi:ClpP/crotonase [Aspergillus fijiensis CBS 313.89]|uniref:acetyl-CoA carboxylase n=1 Tax=Aspergillus fijiensis CBS 313.89 TaxID=1448319 RepID=A0A8G1S2L8_9EURO|nr:ClpP/crotonase [Aspergillus fijiensis CBS 313.89]RAK81321.1 ClpP/crotonase [Aspergillus fijiensis CBS 313.89]
MAIQSSYPPPQSNLDLNNPQYRANRETWKTVLDRFEEALEQVFAEGNSASLARHQKRGQLLLLKTNRIMEIAFQNDLPLISLVQSAGVFLPQQFRVFHKGGQLFRDLAVRTQHGKPSCALVFGSSTAGGAYHPALSDYTIFVENQGQAFLAGPPLVKMATGEVIEAEELGGARVHATKTGLADQIATDELDAIRKAREWVATLHSPSTTTLVDTIEPLPPRYPVDELLSLVNPDIRKPFDMREVLLRLIDDSRFSEFKPEYGRNLITGNTPLLFLHNVTGFMVGAKAEHAGIIRAGAQLVAAVSTSTVPHISVILGASYGAGNYAMCGRAYGPRFLFTWPSGRCSVMGPEQLSGVMESVQRSSAAAKGKVLSPEELRARVERFRAAVQTDAECYATSGGLVDDGIIDPRDTRDVVGMCLEVVVSVGIRGAEGHRMTVSQSPISQNASPSRPPLYVASPPLDTTTGRPIIQRILIANRGEIAVRIIQTCRKLNISTVPVYVTEDSSSRHIREADIAICLGSLSRTTDDYPEQEANDPGNPFLNIPLLIRTALSTQSHAIHPGYGFLSENASFATAVRAAGLIFLGPSTTALTSLGDKRAAKTYLRTHAPAVPLIPGFVGTSQTPADLITAATEIGFPVILKASAGGGGKGMRIVHEPSRLEGELERAQSEAERAFGQNDCILEKFIAAAKHIEIQIVGDEHGTIIAFGERDCSVQRRHQKVVEETPCGVLTDGMRREMCDTAVRIGELIQYAGAGTVEFVVDVQTRRFYFLEVNARLQVEHPITEEVMGWDLVALQVYVAAGGQLKDLPGLEGGGLKAPAQGHAIECRLWAEVSINFDSMIAKIVIWAPTRALAIEKMSGVLAQTACVGVKTNQLFLQRCLLSPEFRKPTYTTAFISSHLEQLLQFPEVPLQESLPLIPSLVIRNLAETGNTCGRPFQHIRRQFRNQPCDPVNIHCDIVTTITGPQAGTSSICVWDPPAAGQSPNLKHVRLLPVPAETEPGSAAAHYNTISNTLRGGSIKAVTPRTMCIDSLQPTEAFSNPSSLPSTFTIKVSVDGRRIGAHVAIPSLGIATGMADRPQRVYCHFPSLGTYMEFQRDSPLLFAESRRRDATTEEAGKRTVTAPMPCKILSIETKNGDLVKAGQVVMVIESMKMELSISVAVEGSFQTEWRKGDAVEEGRVLCSVV